MDIQTTATARANYISLFPSRSDAIEFENQVLSIGREFLPAEALAVLDDSDAASPEYYAWLATQIEHVVDVEVEDPNEPT